MVLATTENNPSEATRVASSHAGTDLGVEADGDLAAPLKWRYPIHGAGARVIFSGWKVVFVDFAGWCQQDENFTTSN